MATIALQRARCISPAQVLYFPEAASQSFKNGEFVYLVSGKLTVFPSDGVAIAGMALQDASTVTDTAIAIQVARPGVVFEGNVSTSVTAITQVGTKYGIVRDGTNKWHHVDVSDTTNTRVVVVDMSPKDDVGDTYGRIYFEVLDEYCQIGATTS